MTVSVRVADAGKRYVKYDDNPMLVSALSFRKRTRRSRLWAVRHVDLDVEAGECVGVIGRNGSGKSTLLQMLCGVTAPTEGLVSVRGRIAPLISVGVGFHPELTGRENVYVNATILGLKKRDIDARFDDIVAFAEIGRFIDTPVKFYSSGMFVRLGFAVAIEANPDVLLVDEVLAVGDLAFQMKCFERMTDIRTSGTTVVVVSHNLNAIRRLCDRAVVLHDGVQRFSGDTIDALSTFHELIGEDRDPDADVTTTGPHAAEGGVTEVELFELLDGNGNPTAHVEGGDDVIFRARVRFLRRVTDPVFGFSLASTSGISVYNDSSIARRTGTFEAGDVIVCDIRVPMRLPTGSYAATLGVQRDDLRVRIGRGGPVLFYVTGRSTVSGVADLGATFDVDTLAAVDADAESPA